MATQTKNKRERRPTVAAKELTRLRAEVARLRAEISTLKAAKPRRTKAHLLRPAKEESLPALPPADANGNYPAEEALNVIVARHIIRRRKALGWTPADLARRAGLRPETLSRLETGKHAPNVATVDKLDKALGSAGA